MDAEADGLVRVMGLELDLGVWIGCISLAMEQGLAILCIL